MLLSLHRFNDYWFNFLCFYDDVEVYKRGVSWFLYSRYHSKETNLTTNPFDTQILVTETQYTVLLLTFPFFASDHLSNGHTVNIAVKGPTAIKDTYGYSLTLNTTWTHVQRQISQKRQKNTKSIRNIHNQISHLKGRCSGFQTM